MQSLKDKDKLYIWHPFTSLTSAPDPIPIVKGEGIYLVDESGNRYIDAISSWWVNLHGHAHPYIAEKIYHQALQLEQVIFAGFTHRPAVTLAERLMPLLPGDFAKIFYSDNGSTSTEVAVKMGLQFWWNQSPNKFPKRTKILAFRNSYHGDTFGSMSVSDRSIFTLAFQDKLFDVIFIDTPTIENISDLKATILLHHEQIAAFIYEPLLQAAGGMKMCDASLMNELLGACQQNEIICIADEVMTGFGRTGKLFASEYMHFKPDIICLSKGLTGGTMALGVTACHQKIVDAFLGEDKMKTFFHGHSFTANPLACTAALASLDLLQKESCLQSIESICRDNQQFITELGNFSTVKNARSLGTVLAFDYISGDYDYLNSISQQITSYMLRKGIYLRPLGNTVYIMPPYCITSKELQILYNAIKDFLK
ncbi:MAG: adenosylmethionine--8-amino-7-oxononanoate transaminase [Chitinophagaceae bacterium]